MHRAIKLAGVTLLISFSLASVVSGLCGAQGAKPPRVGVIILGGPGPSYDAIRQGFAQLGYVEGKTLVLEPRFARGQSAKVPELVSELVGMDVDVIVAVGAVGVSAAKSATSKIPIVFSAVLDPVPLGYAASLERPGGNITGITSFDPQQAIKQLELLREVLPKLTRVAILSDQNIPRGQDGWSPFEKAYEAAARALDLQPRWIRVAGPNPDLSDAFTTMAKEQAEAAVILEVPVTLQNLKSISELALKHRLPTMFPAGWPNEGLITYGTSILNATPLIPKYVDRILKGAKPAEMPIEVITRRELVINLVTAKEIGVAISPELIKRADRVVQ